MVDEHPSSVLDADGIGVINATKILAEVSDIRRFPSAHRFASYTATAPIDVSSAKTTDTGSTAAATGGSTTPFTSPRSARRASQVPATTTTGASATPA